MTTVERLTMWLDNGCAEGLGESPEQQALFEADMRTLLSSAEQLEQLARGVLTMAANGGMPDTYWLSDSRVSQAAKVLGLTNEEAREWAEQEIDRE